MLSVKHFDPKLEKKVRNFSFERLSFCVPFAAR